MRLLSIILVSGCAFGATCSAAPSAFAGDFDLSPAERAQALSTVPAGVTVRPESLLCGGGACAPACAPACPPPCAPEENLCCSPCTKFSLTAGLWIWGISGTVGDNGRQIDIDTEWTDTLENLDLIEFAADVRARLTKGRWSFTMEIDGGELASSGSFLDGRVSVDGQVSMWALQAQVGYNLAGGRLGCGPCAPVGCLEAYAGLRAWWVDLEVDAVGTAAPGARINSSESWVDPIVGFRGDLRFGGKWFAVLEADIGGFGVGSDFSWHVMASVGYQISRHVAVETGWKHLDVDYENGAYIFDVALSGPFLAFTFTF